MRRLGGLVVALLFAAPACSSGDDGVSESAGAEPQGDPAPSASDSPEVVADDDPMCAPARAHTPGTTSGVLTHDGLERTYLVTVPPDYDGATPAPLVLNLHGFAGDGRGQNAGTDMPDRAGARGYVVVAPDGESLTLAAEGPEADEAAERGFEGVTFWNAFGSGAVEFGAGPDLGVDASEIGADDTGFLTALLDALESELCVDSSRVYSTGMSNGAGMTTTLGCEIGSRLAAIAPVAGVSLTATCAGDGPVPVLAIHGDGDELVPWEGNSLFGFELGNPSVLDRMAQWADANGCEPDPTIDDSAPGVVRQTWSGCEVDTELLQISGGGHVWPSGDPIDATATVLDFFDAHSLDERAG